LILWGIQLYRIDTRHEEAFPLYLFQASYFVIPSEGNCFEAPSQPAMKVGMIGVNDVVARNDRYPDFFGLDPEIFPFCAPFLCLYPLAFRMEIFRVALEII
jgi:hypothetical protein